MTTPKTIEYDNLSLRRALIKSTLAAVTLWLVAFITGLWIAAAMPHSVSGLQTDSSLLPTTAPTSFGILRINLIVFALAACGLVTFSMTSIATLTASGMFLGLVAGIGLQSGVSLKTMLWLTLPHGIEIVGLWLAGGVGLLGVRYSHTLFSTKQVLKSADWYLLWKILLLAAILIVIAAFIEGEFTAKLVTATK